MEVDELDRERNALKEQLKNMLGKIGFAVTPEFIERLKHC